MSRADEYRVTLRALESAEWEAFLLAESRLPGPRGNLELAQAVADDGDQDLFLRLAAYDVDRAPTNTPGEFLAFCGVVGLGRLLAEGRMDHLPKIRAAASDPRWRLREAVAMALQRWGRADMPALVKEMGIWAQGNRLEQRAAAAALCEPDLLRDAGQARTVLGVLDRITASVVSAPDRKTEAFRALRKGLGYCWSVAVTALPEEGKPAMERWLACEDADVRWIMRENLRKARLERMDRDWVATWWARLRM